MKKGMFVIAVIVVVAALVWAGIVHGAREAEVRDLHLALVGP